VQRELALSGVEAEHLTLPVPAPGPDFRRVPAADPMFVFCGRLDRTKGVALLLRAFARLWTTVPAARLRIVGTGPDRDGLERLAEGLGLGEAVTFRGWVRPPEVAREIADAWALVAPSLWAEPLGLVALEAIVRGIPVVASASGGLGEIVEHGVSGLLFPNGDVEALAQRLVSIASGAAFPGHTLSDAIVRRAVEAHDPELYTRRLRGIFTSLTTRAATPAASHA
jgi:glycogen(starch) synthase